MIKSRIILRHPEATTIASSLSPDNLPDMKVRVKKDEITLDITTDRIRSLISTLDDFLANAKIAEELADSASRNKTK